MKWNNPYALDRYRVEDIRDMATMALACEQYMRNRIAYLTLKSRSWYDGDEELDDYFGE